MLARFALAAVVALSAVSVFPAVVASSPVTTAAKDYWTVKFSSNYAGPILSQFSRTAIRMKIDKFGITVVAKAPDWHTYVYNETNQRFLELAHGEWKDKLDMTRFGGRRRVDKVDFQISKTNHSKNILGIKAEEKLVKEVLPNKALKLRADVWMASTIDPPDQFTELFSVVFPNIPSLKHGLPLSVTWVPDTGKPTVVLDAYKIENAPVAASSFEMPKGYKKVQDQMALMFDESDMDIMGTGAEEPHSSPADAKSREQLTKLLNKAKER